MGLIWEEVVSCVVKRTVWISVRSGLTHAGRCGAVMGLHGLDWLKQKWIANEAVHVGHRCVVNGITWFSCQIYRIINIIFNTQWKAVKNVTERYFCKSLLLIRLGILIYGCSINVCMYITERKSWVWEFVFLWSSTSSLVIISHISHESRPIFHSDLIWPELDNDLCLAWHEPLSSSSLRKHFRRILFAAVSRLV